MYCTVSTITSSVLARVPNHGPISNEYQMIAMNTALTGNTMFRSTVTMRRNCRAGSGAGISIAANNRFSHCSWLGFIVSFIRRVRVSPFKFQLKLPAARFEVWCWEVLFQLSQHPFRDFFHRPQATDAFVSARQHSLVRPDEF